MLHLIEPTIDTILGYRKVTWEVYDTSKYDVNLAEDVNNQYNETLTLNPGHPEEILDQSSKIIFYHLLQVCILYFILAQFHNPTLIRVPPTTGSPVVSYFYGYRDSK